MPFSTKMCSKWSVYEQSWKVEKSKLEPNKGFLGLRPPHHNPGPLPDFSSVSGAGKANGVLPVCACEYKTVFQWNWKHCSETLQPTTGETTLWSLLSPICKIFGTNAHMSRKWIKTETDQSWRSQCHPVLRMRQSFLYRETGVKEFQCLRRDKARTLRFGDATIGSKMGWPTIHHSCCHRSLCRLRGFVHCHEVNEAWKIPWPWSGLG